MCATKRSAEAMLAEQDIVSQRDGYLGFPSPASSYAIPDTGPLTPERSPSSSSCGTCSSSSSSSDDEFNEIVPLSADSCYSSSKLMLATLGRTIVEKENRPPNVPKRIKLADDERPPLGERRLFSSVASNVSTAASTPAATPLTSPMLSAKDPPKVVIQKPQKDHYSKLTDEELREQLGVVGTNIAVGWDKEDLISVLQTLEDIMAEMPALEL